MSIKLTKGNRELLCKILLKRRFEKEEKKLAEDWKKFGDRVYETTYSKKDREQMAALPEGWLGTRTSASYQFGSSYHTVMFSKEFRFLNKDSNPYYHRAIRVFNATEKICDEYKALEDRESNLKSQKSEAEHSIMSVLNSATTVGKLREIWPEIAKDLDQFEVPPASAGVPAVQISKVNELLNLKPTK